MKLRVVGISEDSHVGGHFLRAAATLGIDASLSNVMDAYSGPRILKSLCWHLLGRRPLRLNAFGRRVVENCARDKPDLVLSTGLAPLNASTVAGLRAMKIKMANFLTDDPWNPHHHTPWFMKALPAYDHVFTPRRANISDIVGLRGPHVHYLPFAYAPEIHHPPALPSSETSGKWQSDVLFIGGADDERASVMRTLVQRGLMPSLWGGYWERYKDLRSFARGHAGPVEFRQLVQAAGVNLCLVRRANRDGHSMRSFELPAVGGCLAVEDTSEHREIFGPDGECVGYFSGMDDLVNLCRSLLHQPEERKRRTRQVRQRICVDGRNSYADRLSEIMERSMA